MIVSGDTPSTINPVPSKSQYIIQKGKNFIQKGKNFIQKGINYTNTISAALPYKLIFLIAFFTIFYNVIYQICIFFGIDIIILNMYMGWLSFILILFTFLTEKYGKIFNNDEAH
jgi:hypothetical protein